MQTQPPPPVIAEIRRSVACRKYNSLPDCKNTLRELRLEFNGRYSIHIEHFSYLVNA